MAETSTARPWETPVVIVLESESSQQRAASRRWTAVILSSVSLLAICGFLLASSGSVKAPVSLGAYSWGCDGCLPGSRYFPPSAAKAFGHYEVYADPGKTLAIQRIAERLGVDSAKRSKPAHVSGGHWEFVKIGGGRASEAQAHEEERDAGREGEGRGAERSGASGAEQQMSEEEHRYHWGSKEHKDYAGEVYGAQYKPDAEVQHHWGTKHHDDYADEVYSQAYAPTPQLKLHWGTKKHDDYVDQVYAHAYQPDVALPYHWGTRKHEDYPEDVYGRPFVSWDLPYGVKWAPKTSAASDPAHAIPEAPSTSVPWDTYIAHYGPQVPAAAYAVPKESAPKTANTGHWAWLSDPQPVQVAPTGAVQYHKTVAAQAYVHLPVWPGSPNSLPPPDTTTEVHYGGGRVVQWNGYHGPLSHAWWVHGPHVGHTIVAGDGTTYYHSGSWQWVQTGKKQVVAPAPGPPGPPGASGSAGHVNVFVMPSPAGPPGPPGPPAPSATVFQIEAPPPSPPSVPLIPAAAPAIPAIPAAAVTPAVTTNTRTVVKQTVAPTAVHIGGGAGLVTQGGVVRGQVPVVVEGVQTVGSGGLGWGYGGSHGPSHWGELAKAYKTCSAGERQSPINVATAALKAVPSVSVPPLEWQLPVQLTANPGALWLQGGTLVMKHMSGAPIVIVSGEPYGLAGVSVHTPSEHTIDGVHADAEVQVRLAHTDAKGGPTSHVVMSLLLHMDASLEPPWVSPLAKGVALAHGKKVVQVGGVKPNTPTAVGAVDVKDLLEEVVHMEKWYRYEGSWTAPPCTEGVTWYVGQGSRGISGPNLDLLASVEGRNDRPTQHLNGRTISLVVPRVPN